MIKDLVKKLKVFEDKSGLKLYQEIMDDIFKIEQQLKRLRSSRDSWRKNCEEQKEKVHALENHIEMLEAGK